MQIDDQLIKRLSKLSSIELQNDEQNEIKTQLEEIVNFVENLNDIDVDNVEATFNTIDSGTLLREDIPSKNEELSKHVLQHAHKSTDGYFVVPKIIE